VNIDVDSAKWAECEINRNGNYERYKNTNTGISPMLFPPSKNVIKWNSHEHDEYGITTEQSETVTLMQDKRIKKIESIKDFLKKLKTVNIYGKKGNIIITYGSTTMSVLEAIKFGDIEATVIQPIYLNPFPTWEFDKYQPEEVIVVEQSAIGQLSNLLNSSTNITIKKTIKKYDGRPFDPIELSKKIKEAMSNE
ncbi:MAG: 2-oxoacid:acceptor oxidoreductase subunit alpha, partial [Promethearchaeota archaeon]